MILHSAPANEAVLSNVGAVNSFTIKATAKSFRILSDGLYANKIRAIIRELSCNAYDSHVAAGRSDVPFEVHLPSTLEPWFAVRDFGLGLSAEQVTSIFTTFFESTKTGSNDFVGALGLGSKSPFSYTDNFTVTAVQDGQRGVYTAFINDEGVPSIAVMAQDRTDEPNGVEVRFSVDNPRDFGKFAEEAGHVFVYFATQPQFRGHSVDVRTPEYEVRDVMPGVHQVSGHALGTSVAVMGNIAYPIQIPTSHDIDAELRNLLDCHLEMHFGIGELDFQASREGLSYIPQTVNAIVARLRATAESLSVRLAVEADAIPNLWDRAVFLAQRRSSPLWRPAVTLYAARNPIPTFASIGSSSYQSYQATATFEFTTEALAQDYNISMTVLERNAQWDGVRVRQIKPYSKWDKDSQRSIETVSIEVDGRSHFVVNEEKTGAVARARYHYGRSGKHGTQRILVLQRADAAKDILLHDFLAAIHNPPSDRVVDVNTLTKKPRADRAQTMSIVQAVRSSNRRNRGDLVWSDPVKLDTRDTTRTFYYIPLKHHQLISRFGYLQLCQLYNEAGAICDIDKLGLYGVRKSELENVQKMPNWVNIEDHMVSLMTPDMIESLMMSRVRERLVDYNILSFPKQQAIISHLADPRGAYATLVQRFLKVNRRIDHGRQVSLIQRFAGGHGADVDHLVTKYQGQLDQLARQYPMLAMVREYDAEPRIIADYINAMDQVAAAQAVPKLASKKQVADLV